jgi:hypothetical protein
LQPKATVPGQSTRGGDLIADQSTMESRSFLRGNDPWPKRYTLQHQTHEGVARRGVLTGEVFGVTGNGGIEVENSQIEGEDHFSLVPKLHKEGTDIRSPFEKAPDDERRRKRSSLLSGRGGAKIRGGG